MEKIRGPSLPADLPFLRDGHRVARSRGHVAHAARVQGLDGARGRVVLEVAVPQETAEPAGRGRSWSVGRGRFKALYSIPTTTQGNTEATSEPLRHTHHSCAPLHPSLCHLAMLSPVAVSLALPDVS